MFFIGSSRAQLSERGGIRNSEFRRKGGPIHPHQAMMERIHAAMQRKTAQPLTRC
jgi:hypothetical protein